VFSPDGQQLASASEGLHVKLWDAADGRLLRTFTNPTEKVAALAFSPDGRTLLTGSYDGTARLWDVGTAKPLCPPLPHAGPVLGVVVRPDGQRVLTGCADGTVQVWDVPLSWPGDGRRLRTEIEALAGMVLEENDIVRILGPDEELQRR
jgi:WD40 repeat protein